jgi:hypothetical protein
MPLDVWIERWGTPGRLRQRDLDPGLIQAIEERQGYDLALYVYALERDWSGEWLDKRPRRI